MTGRPRILVAVGTRPEAVKMAPVIHILRAADWCELQVVATAQHREMLDQILAFFGIATDLDLDLMRPEQALPSLTARMLGDLDAALEDQQPDFVLAQGDTTTVFVTALACFYRKIPMGHVEAGLRTHRKDSPYPEEMNRQLVGRLADLHFAPTELSAENLRREGVPDAAIHVTGNTVVDALLWAIERVPPFPDPPVPGKRLVLVTAHRRENFGAKMEGVFRAVRALADRPDVEILFPVHRNPRVRAAADKILRGHDSIRLTDPLGYPEFVAAMMACDLILSDSGGVQEEAPSLSKPVLVLRENTERPEGLAAGTSLLVGTDPERILAEAARLLDDEGAYRAMAGRENPFGDGQASARIAAVVRERLCGNVLEEL